MAITVATATVTNTALKFPDRKRVDYYFEDDQGNVGDYRGIDAPAGFNEVGFMNTQLAPSWERSVKERAIRLDEEAKAASELAVLEQAVTDKKEAIDDATDARIKADKEAKK